MLLSKILQRLLNHLLMLPVIHLTIHLPPKKFTPLPLRHILLPTIPPIAPLTTILLQIPKTIEIKTLRCLTLTHNNLPVLPATVCNLI